MLLSFRGGIFSGNANGSIDGESLCIYIMDMIKWGVEKEAKLLAERNIDLREISEIIGKGEIVGVELVPNQDDHPGQKMAVVRYKGDYCCVPYAIQDDGDWFLKTAFFSRLARKKYGGRK